MYSYIEECVYELFFSLGVKNPTDLNMKEIARRLEVEISYRRRAFRYENEILLVEATESEEWMEFGHEICHYLRHCGNQLNMHPLFKELQEWQAGHFAYHFCIPTFMLNKMRFPNDRDAAIWLIAHTFNVDYDFAERRLDMWINKRQTFICFSQFASSLY